MYSKQSFFIEYFKTQKSLYCNRSAQLPENSKFTLLSVPERDHFSAKPNFHILDRNDIIVQPSKHTGETPYHRPASWRKFASCLSRKNSLRQVAKGGHWVLVNILVDISLPRKSVFRLNDHPNMTTFVYCEHKMTTQPPLFKHGNIIYA